MSSNTIRNVAIVAHVDHGKTTLVDALFRFAGTFRKGQQVQERVLDSNAQERERGITILAKNTAIEYHGQRVNIVDTPGHADFGGQVERTLSMADAVLLLVDAFEGPMPQTRFVLSKAFEHGLKALVMINKVDRPDARPDEVLNEVFDLFVDLGADDEQLDFPIVYGSGRDAWAVRDSHQTSNDLQALMDMLMEELPTPDADSKGPVLFQAATLDRDDYLGRIAVGRVHRGTLKVGERLMIAHPNRGKPTPVTLKNLFRYEGLKRVPREMVTAGDVAVVTGIEEIGIGDTLCHPEHIEPLPAIAIDEPTISMVFRINNSPMAGTEGQFVTSRHLIARLERATTRDVALLVKSTDSADSFEVCGRGVMHLSVLIEEMRREGYEFSVGKPHVILKEVDGRTCEPYERAAVEVPSDSAGRIIEYLGRRRGEMLDMTHIGKLAKVEFRIPARGLIGARTALLTLSQGEAVLSHVFDCWGPDGGVIPRRTNGVLISDRGGPVVAYALDGLQDRGQFFVAPGDTVYEGMIVGENSKDADLELNVCRAKKLTNMRASGRDDNTKITPPILMSLEEMLEYVEDDEVVEITPKSMRLRKIQLDPNVRKRERRRATGV
ncbi:MAG TPA: translational GTPase TypA [Planctomycetes bacterium]|nr:translational GTPase TypA [Planctomycetota bacterium]HIL36159.1 translational GTPase TypA [Planctomycetota bacterium]